MKTTALINKQLLPLARPIGSLKLDPQNAMDHPETNLGAIKASYSKFGQNKPIVALKNGTVIDGNGQLQAAKELGWEKIAVVIFEKEEDARAYAIAANRTAQLATWNPKVLAPYLKGIQDTERRALGFSGTDFKKLVKNLDRVEDHGKAVAQDTIPGIPKNILVKPGQMWALGEHRLMCGRSDEPAPVALLRPPECSLMLTDPPYGVGFKYLGHDDTDNAENLALVQKAFALFPHPKIWTPGLLNLARDLAWNFQARVLCWHKGFSKVANGFDGASTWEPILVTGFVHGRKMAKLPDNHLAYPTNRMLELRHEALCPKPLELYGHLLKCFTGKGDWVYDPFGGSGTTLIAAEKLGRRCAMMEKVPVYCQLTINRWEKIAGRKAELLKV